MSTPAILRMRWGDEPQGVTRDVSVDDERGSPEWPWILDCDPAFEA